MNIKETWANIKRKTTEFIYNHPYIAIGASVLIGYAVNELINYEPKPHEVTRDQMENIVNSYDYEQNEGNRPGKTMLQTPEWNESYRENWNKVKSFANELDLQKDEMYIIEPGSTYEDEGWFEGDPNTMIISHMINGYGVYPPEEEKVDA